MKHQNEHDEEVSEIKMAGQCKEGSRKIWNK